MKDLITLIQEKTDQSRFEIYNDAMQFVDMGLCTSCTEALQYMLEIL